MRTWWSRAGASSLAAVVVLGLVIGCSDGGPGGPDGPGAVPISGECDERIQGALSAWGAAGFNGAVVIDDGSGGTCRLGVGTVEPGGDRAVSAGSVFAIGSVSKAFTAAAVLQLVGEGAVDLAEPAGRYVAGLHGPAADASIESLLLHTSGLVGSHGEDDTALTRDQAVASISALPVDAAAQGRFLYSNAGYTLLALVVEAASGVEYRQYLADRVLPDGAGFWDGDPAATGERVVGVVDGNPVGEQGDVAGPHWAVQGNGDLAMSVDVLARWTRDLFAGAIAPASMLERLVEPAVDDGEQGITMGWARLDADVLGETALAAAGGGGDTGHNVVVVWLPESERTMIVASSTDLITAEALLRAVGPAIVGGREPPRPDEPVDVDPALLRAAAGSYALTAGGGFDVVAADDHVQVVPTGPAAFNALDLAAGASPDQVTEHEAAVEALLAGRTAAGAEEVAILEADSGPLGDVEVLGSMVEDGELRTFVELGFGDGAVTGWYALNRSGGIEGVDLAGPPTVELVGAAGGFGIRGRPPGDEAVTVTFDDGAMTIRGPGGVVVAQRG